MTTKTHLFDQKMAEKKKFKDANPPKQYKNHQNGCMFTQMFPNASRTVVTFKSHPKYLKALIIKWTISGELPVGSRLENSPGL